MKYILVLIMLLGLSGCATAGRFLKGMGDGLSQPRQQATIPQTQYCYGSDDGYSIRVNCY